MEILKLPERRHNGMLRISDEDYRALEMKIQKEVRKIFAQFREDLERKNSLLDEMEIAHDLQKSSQLTKPGSVKSIRTSAEPRKRRTSKKTRELNRLLEGTPHPDRKSSSKILEENMDKIFRKKYRRDPS